MRSAALILLALLVGCADTRGNRPLKPLEIPLAPYSGVITAALTGSLMYEGGCLLFRDEDNRTQLMPVWPYGSTFNGTSVTFHEPGKADQRVIVGEELLIAGQPVDWTRFRNSRVALHERQCSRPLFAVLGVHPAN